MSARFALKSATADAHQRLDDLFSSFDLGNRAGYGDFLMAQAGAFASVEDALQRAGASDLAPDWSERRRASALALDLAALNLAPPPQIPSPTFASEAATLGGIYVLEGSRLGGAMLVRAVPDDLPRNFLAPGNPESWRAFISVLDRKLNSQADLDVAAGAAIAVFETFASSARAILEQTKP